MEIEFKKYKNKILKALKKRDLNIDEPCSLIEGFFNPLIHDELSFGLVICGPSVIMIYLVGNKSGRLYPFALKALLPHLNN